MTDNDNNSVAMLPKERTVKVNESAERPQWDSKIEFLLSSIGFAVGLGNIWRFPYIAYKNGGGTFLIPYTIMLLFVGIPLFFMQSALGQYCGQGPTKIYGNLAPAFKGLGFAMIYISFLVCLYYNVIIAWTIFYMFAGMRSELPWSKCEQERIDDLYCSENKIIINTSTPIESKFIVGPAEDYFNHQVLGFDKKETRWDNFGGMRWQMVLCLLGAWSIVCLCLLKGVQSAGKVVYFTATYPFVILIILFGYGLSLEGSGNGILFYLTPKPELLKEIDVWRDAAIQIFYSLGIGGAGLTTLSSYNKFNNNCQRDTLIVCFINCGTSFFAGFAIFAILGYMANVQGVDVGDVVKSGTGLAFIAYPDALSLMGDNPVPQIMSFLFFTMLLTLGIDSMFTVVETITTCIFDHFNQLVPYKAAVVTITCAIHFVLGLSMCADGGFLMFNLFNNCSESWNSLIIALVAVVLVSWGYGADRFMGNIEEMGMHLSRPVALYWKICWKFITPGIITIVVILTFVKHEKLETPLYKEADQDQDVVYVWPETIQALGLLMPISTLLIVPAIALYQVLHRKANGKTVSGKTMFTLTNNWKASPDSMIHKEDDNLEGTMSRRASRLSFRRHLPSFSERFI